MPNASKGFQTMIRRICFLTMVLLFSGMCSSANAQEPKTHCFAIRLTQEMAKEWRDFYQAVKAANPSNPSAAGRAQLMDYAYKLLGGK
jgi:hypothetical protein